MVNVSSQAGHMALSRMGKDLRARFLTPDLTLDHLSALMNEFMDVVKLQDGDSRGWPGTFYGISKLGVTLLSVLQQKELDRSPRNDILVNAGMMRLIFHVSGRSFRDRPLYSFHQTCSLLMELQAGQS